MSHNSLMDRFFSKVKKSESGCWEWIGSLSHEYGQFFYKGKNHRAHRVSWFIHHNFWPELLVCHHCDNPKCVNPSHLFLGTNTDNRQDCLKKGRLKVNPPKGEKSINAKLTNAQVKEIKIKLRMGIRSCDLSREYSVTRTTIHGIKFGLTWKHID